MLINKSEVRKQALEASKNLKNGKFTRVSDGFYEWLDREVSTLIRRYVQNLPTVGKTIQ